MEFLSLFKKHGLSYAIFEISFSSPKTWTIICNFRNFYPFSKYVDYHMKFLKFHSLLHKRGLSYASFKNSFPFFKTMDHHMQVSRIPFHSPKTWNIICNLWNFFLFSKNVDYHT